MVFCGIGAAVESEEVLAECIVAHEVSSKQISENASPAAKCRELFHFMLRDKKHARRPVERTAGVGVKNRERGLLLPSTLLVAIQTQLLAPFVFIDFGLTALFQ